MRKILPGKNQAVFFVLKFYTGKKTSLYPDPVLQSRRITMEETGNNCENMLHSIKRELNPAETYQLLKILQPYAATIRKTVLSQSGEWMSEYLQAHISDDYAGIVSKAKR